MVVISGACVSFDVGFPAVVDPLKRGNEPLPREYSGVPARLALTSNGKCKGGQRLSAAFFPSGERPRDQIWNAYSDTCNDAQLRRVKEFLFVPGTGPRMYPQNPDRGRLHTRAE